jgi:hypothetical protein
LAHDGNDVYLLGSSAVGCAKARITSKPTLQTPTMRIFLLRITPLGALAARQLGLGTLALLSLINAAVLAWFFCCS